MKKNIRTKFNFR